MRLHHALAQRRVQRAELAAHLVRVRAAGAELRRQYRVQPALPLGIAALGGYALARVRPDWRPPNDLLRIAWRWSLLFLRGLT